MKTKDQPAPSRASTNFVPVVLTLVASALVAWSADALARAPDLRYTIVATLPHDASSFTQGLAIVDGALAESSGGYGRSRITLRGLRDGAVRQQRTLPADFFGEGLASDGAQLLQLTWRSGIALRWSPALQPGGRFSYAGEGWGLAWDGAQWLMSDGSDRIQRRRAADFAPLGSVAVRDGARAIPRLNELEYARGVLFANVWHADSIAAIDPATGRVLGWLELSALKRGFTRPAGWNPAEHVLNGIAHDPATGHLFVTGKCWPVMYELKLEPWPAP